MKNKENSAPKAEEPPRKKNFFERNRFVNYERPQDSDDDQPAKPADSKVDVEQIVSGSLSDIQQLDFNPPQEIVEVKQSAPVSSAPPATAVSAAPVEEKKPEVVSKEKSEEYSDDNDWNMSQDDMFAKEEVKPVK